jgi:hypothetical protein
MAGGGVGEAMLIGAAVGATAGGAGAAIQGGDPLQGALMGGAMGAVGGGLGGAAGGVGGTAAGGVGAAGGAGTGAAAGTTAGVGAGTTAGAGTGAGFGTLGGAGSSAGIATTQAAAGLGSSISGVGAGSGALGSSGFGAAGGAGYGAMGGAGSSAGIAGTQGAAGLGAGAGTTAPVTNVFGQVAGSPGYLSNTALGMTAGTAGLAGAMGAERAQMGVPPDEEYDGPLSKLKYDPNKFTASAPQYAPASVYRPTYAAEGGIMKLADGGGYGYPMNKNPDTTPNLETSYGMAKGGIARYAPGGMIDPSMGIAAAQQGAPQNNQQSYGEGIDALIGNKKRMLTKEQMDAVAMQGMSKGALKDIYGEMASQNLAKGGPAGNKDMIAIDNYVAAAQGGDMASVMAKAQAGDYNAMIALNKVRKTPNQNYAKGGHLGGYSDGGRMLKGPGDGMSDSIPGVIANKQPARLADGEFVVPADVVSHLGNGSTDAGAKQLYAMMNRVRKARTGNSKQGKQIKPAKYMAA